MDKYKIAYTNESILEMKEISNWYNGKRNGLGLRFKREMKVEIDRLKEKPYLFEIRYDMIRIVFSKNFPYAAHYEINESKKTVIIHAMLAFKQDIEGYWLKRNG